MKLTEHERGVLDAIGIAGVCIGTDDMALVTGEEIAETFNGWSYCNKGRFVIGPQGAHQTVASLVRKGLAFKDRAGGKVVVGLTGQGRRIYENGEETSTPSAASPRDVVKGATLSP